MDLPGTSMLRDLLCFQNRDALGIGAGERGMVRSQAAEVPGSRSQYAERQDFCDTLAREMKQFYLLAFLLTANHKEAEQCFASLVERGYKENVLKAWVGSWLRRCLIKEAIRIVFSRSAANEPQRNPWSDTLGEIRDVVTAVTGLEALERFVFVMSMLEGYPTLDCSLLLNCKMGTVIELRAQASRRIATAGRLAPADWTTISDGRQSA
jgi:DNA-directed RNA polymerase specialized sigma24 family protein